MKTRVALLLFLLVTTFQSCIRVQLVPEYSEAIERQIIETQKMNVKLYLTLLAKPVQQRTYESCESEYVNIESNINSLAFQLSIREKNKNFVVMIDKLKDNFSQYKKEHQEKITLNDGEIKIYMLYINDFYTPLLLSEKALLTIKN